MEKDEFNYKIQSVAAANPSKSKLEGVTEIMSFFIKIMILPIFTQNEKVYVTFERLIFLSLKYHRVTEQT